MAQAQKRSPAIDYLIIAALAVLMAFNYQIFILHNAFAPSGISGLATIIQHLCGFSVGYMSLITNIPLAIFCFCRVEKQFAVKTFVNVIVFSITLLLLQRNIIDVRPFVYHTNDGRSTLLAPVAAGTVNGFIYGYSIKSGGSTGGTDYVAAVIHKKRPEYSMLRIIFVINCCVATLSYFVFDYSIEPVILSIVYNFLTQQISDNILKGGKQALKIEMITAYPREVTDRLIRELRHSVTIINVEGGYSHQPKTMLICVINKHQITKFTDIISEFPDTFACVSSVNETLGNFKKISH